MPKRKQRPGAANKGPPAPAPKPELKSQQTQTEPTTGGGESEDREEGLADTSSSTAAKSKSAADAPRGDTSPKTGDGPTSSDGITGGASADDDAFTATQLRQLRYVVTSALVEQNRTGGGGNDGVRGGGVGIQAKAPAPTKSAPAPAAAPDEEEGDDDAAGSSLRLRRLHGQFTAKLTESAGVVVASEETIKGLADDLVRVAAPFVVGTGSGSNVVVSAALIAAGVDPSPSAEEAVKVKTEEEAVVVGDGNADEEREDGEDDNGGEGEDEDEHDEDEDDEVDVRHRRGGRGGGGGNNNKRPRRSLTERWNDRFAELVEYKERNGDCLVPKRYGQLGRWVKKQREHYRLVKEGKTSTLTPSRIEQLEGLGFRWSIVRRDDWNTRLEELARYRREKGDCLVPKKYSLNPPLGRWVDRQRNQHKHLLEGKASTLNDERLKQLNALGFCWSVKDARQHQPHDGADGEAEVEVEVEVEVASEKGDAKEEGGGGRVGAGVAKVTEGMDVDDEEDAANADGDAAMAGAEEKAEKDGGAAVARGAKGVLFV